MAFEIQEISIQMEVGDTPRPATGSAGQDPASSGPVDVDAIVARCVRAVLKALQEARER